MKNYFVLAALIMLPIMSCKKDNPTDPEEEVNTPPTAPAFLDAPENGELEVGTAFTFTWSASTDVDGDPVKYTVYLGTNEDELDAVAEGLAVTNYSVSDLALETIYFIKVTASDDINTAVSSEIREFTTTTTGVFTDSRDGMIYGTEKIGEQIWMKENLKFNSGGSYSYDDNTSNDETYGRLYEWTAADDAIPDGWHLPTDSEWKTLETTLGMSSGDLDINGYSLPRGSDQGTQLKEGGSSELDFPLAGFRSGGTYSAKDNRTYLWVNTTSGGNIFRRRLVTADPSVYRFTNPAGDFAISIRLVKD
ncbi:MAG: hypothetical protein ACI8ZM_003780 [Crocinitomix sp.]|jgi:uncharacterized protein (TIGR02145 family)